MVVSDENNSNSTIMPRNFPGGVRQNRRTLSVINQNIGPGTPYPSVVNKRVLSEKHEICEKKHVDPVHRPATRKFAAQIASSQQSNAEKTKNSNPLISNMNEFGDSIAIGDEHKLSADKPGPMALEPMLSDLDEMEEVEMEDIDEEEILDIDSPDANNFLAVVEYIEDLLSFYREMEYIGCVPPNYMEHQTDINEQMRAILIDWLIFMMHYEFDLMQETVFLTINLVDRYLSKQTVTRKKLQLVGLVAMLLACKYEEVCPPVVSDLILISDKTYTRGEILELEKLMINTLQYNISMPTAYVFIRRFLKAAQADQKLELVAFFLLELSLVEYEMLKFPPSLLAAAAVYTAQCTVNGFRRWDKTCQWHTNYTEDQLLECSSLMVGLHQKAGTGNLTGVHRIYCSSMFSFAAECEPACFLLENKL